MGDAAKEDGTMATSQQALCSLDSPATKDTCCSQLKMFIVALSFAFFSKALAGTYMKSSITQIERRFDLSSSLVGLVDAGFEMGNLLFLAVVSHFGASLHRPKLIAAGCVLMAVGSALTGLPHFFMGRYEYNTIIQGTLNESTNMVPCFAPEMPNTQLRSSPEKPEGCAREKYSHMWVYVFLGNALRGIGESPVTPLGISYIDDFAKAENSAFYIACLQTITLLGPMFGFLLGSMCAKIYVDIGFVDLNGVTITPKDARWVGAWWLGFFVSSVITLVASIPFWFLPRSVPKQGQELRESKQDSSSTTEQTSQQNTRLADIAKGFLPSLKALVCNPTYFLLLCGNVLIYNSFIGLFTFKAKYMEQQFGQSAFHANFLIGVMNLPAVALGIFMGGVLMKRYKLSVVAGAQFSFVASFLAYLLIISELWIKCENLKVAGLTVSYNGTPMVSFDDGTLVAPCNNHCNCSKTDWDPVCSNNSVTYISPCLAGCTSYSGSGLNTTFHNCNCVESGDLSVSLGQCPRSPDCSTSFATYITVSVLSSFISSLGTTPGYMVIIRCIKPELKSLALGVQALVIRTLGGIPAPVYFGALIDITCLKWGVKKCGGIGACRLYESDMYRVIFLGLIASLSGSSYFFVIVVIVLLKKQFQTMSGQVPNGATMTYDLELLNPHKGSHKGDFSSLDQDGKERDQKKEGAPVVPLSSSDPLQRGDPARVD